MEIISPFSYDSCVSPATDKPERPLRADAERNRQRILDAATGVLEEGWIDVAAMVGRQPWLGEDLPVHPEPGTERSGAAASAA